MSQPRRTSGEVEEAITRYRSAVYGLALAKTGRAADADDVFQETFLAYYQSTKVFREEEHRRAWLLRTALNFSRRVTDASRRRRTAPLEEAEEMAALSLETPEQTQVWEAVAGLPEEYRLPIYLFYFQSLSTGEIAQVLRLRPGTVRTRLSRGRERLRVALKGGYEDEL